MLLWLKYAYGLIDIRAPFNMGGGTVFRDGRQLLYLRKSFPSPEPNRILVAFTRGTPRAISMVCMHPKRLPLTRNYCKYRWVTWPKNST